MKDIEIENTNVNDLLERLIKAEAELKTDRFKKIKKQALQGALILTSVGGVILETVMQFYSSFNTNTLETLLQVFVLFVSVYCYYKFLYINFDYNWYKAAYEASKLESKLIVKNIYDTLLSNDEDSKWYHFVTKEQRNALNDFYKKNNGPSLKRKYLKQAKKNAK